jgi:predicted Zn-dependent peptidase
MDAVTAREFVSYWVNVPVGHLPSAIDVLWDFVREPLLLPEDVEKEKEVIIEEISELQDDPEAVVDGLVYQSVWPGTSYAQPPYGSVEAVRAVSHADVVEYHATHYQLDRMVLVVGGDVRHDEVQECLRERCGVARGLDAGTSLGHATRPVAAHEQASESCGPSCFEGPRYIAREEDRTPGYLRLAFVTPAPVSGSSVWYPVIASLLGDGISSHLYQALREETGVAYSIAADYEPLSQAGLLTITVATRDASRAMQLLATALKRVKSLPRDALERARRRYLGWFAMESDEIYFAVSHVARFETLFGTGRSPAETARELSSLDIEDMRRTMEELLVPVNASVAVFGSEPDEEQALTALERLI